MPPDQNRITSLHRLTESGTEGEPRARYVSPNSEAALALFSMIDGKNHLLTTDKCAVAFCVAVLVSLPTRSNDAF